MRSNMSRSQKGTQAGENHPMYGKHHTNESKLKTSNSMKEYRKTHEVSQSTRDKLSEAMSGENNPMYGKTLSKHTRELISQNTKEALNSEEMTRITEEYHEIAYRTYAYECCGCGKSSGKLHVHHINEDHFDNNPDNLIWLCRGCHSKAHSSDKSHIARFIEVRSNKLLKWEVPSMSITGNKGRLLGTAMTERLDPVVKLVSCTGNPVGTLFCLWHNSRNFKAMNAQEIQTMYDILTGRLDAKFGPRLKEVAQHLEELYPEYEGDLLKIITELARMNIVANVPSCECIHFNFEIDNCSVALREQLVRNRQAGYWTQTSRTQNLSMMNVNMSQAVLDAGPEAVQYFEDVVQIIRDAYVRLEELGVPIEEIRLAPECRVHRVTQMTNLRNLLGTLGKRADWMCQMSLFSPLFVQYTEILRDISPFFEEFVGNPEVKVFDKKVTFHKYDNENLDRYTARDYQPVDPLWLAYKGVTMPEHTDIEFYDKMKAMYIKVWNQKYLDVLGWDKDDPNKIGKFDRPASWFESQGLSHMIEDLDTQLQDL